MIVRMSITSRISRESEIKNGALNYRPTLLERYLFHAVNPLPLAALKTAQLSASMNFGLPSILFKTRGGDEITLNYDQTRTVLEMFVQSEDKMTRINTGWSDDAAESIVDVRYGSVILLIFFLSFIGFLTWAAIWYSI